MILDHIGLSVRDFGRSATFFRRALAPLRIHTVLEGEGWAMLGKEGRPQFWIGVHGIPPGPIHIAFASPAPTAGARSPPRTFSSPRARSRCPRRAPRMPPAS